MADDKCNGWQNKRKHGYKISNKLPTAMVLFTAQEANQKSNGIFCSALHNSLECFKARKMTYQEKLKCMRDLKCCYLFLKRSHMSKQC